MLLGNDVADHFILNLERFGIICYKKHQDPVLRFAFAWQIYQRPRLFIRFNEVDRTFLENMAIIEQQDEWYVKAGEQLMGLGFETFLKAQS